MMKLDVTRRAFARAALLPLSPAVGAATTPGALVAFRISHHHWVDDRRFEALLAFFDRQPGVANEQARRSADNRT